MDVPCGQAGINGIAIVGVWDAVGGVGGIGSDSSAEDTSRVDSHSYSVVERSPW